MVRFVHSHHTHYTSLVEVAGSVMGSEDYRGQECLCCNTIPSSSLLFDPWSDWQHVLHNKHDDKHASDRRVPSDIYRMGSTTHKHTAHPWPTWIAIPDASGCIQTHTAVRSPLQQRIARCRERLALKAPGRRLQGEQRAQFTFHTELSATRAFGPGSQLGTPDRMPVVRCATSISVFSDIQYRFLDRALFSTLSKGSNLTRNRRNNILGIRHESEGNRMSFSLI